MKGREEMVYNSNLSPLPDLYSLQKRLNSVHPLSSAVQDSIIPGPVDHDGVVVEGGVSCAIQVCSFLLEVSFKSRFNIFKKNLNVQVPIRPHHLMCGTL